MNSNGILRDSRQPRPEALWWALGVVLVGALLLRLWGIGYGLPFVYWTDEYHEVMRAMELGAGGFNFDRTGKGGFYLLLFFEYGLYFLALKLTGVVSTTNEFAELFVRDPTAFYVLGRATAAVFGTATVAFAFLFARRAYQSWAGLLSALFIAVNLLHVDLSHRVGVDVPMALFVTMALYFGVRIAQDGGTRDYMLAGLCASLATTTKLPGIVVLLPLLIAHAFNVGRGPDALRRLVASSRVWGALTLFAVVWIATNPGILQAGDLFSIFSGSETEVSEETALGSIRPNLWIYYLEVLQSSMGWPLFLVSIAGFGHAIWKREPADLMLIALALLTYVAIASTTSDKLYFPRYTLPIIVALSILAGRTISDAASLAERWRPVFVGAAIIVLIAWPLTHSVRFSHSLTLTDTRTLAKDWIDAHIPPESRILIEGGKISPTRTTVPLDESREALERRIEYWKAVEPRQAKYLETKLATQADGGFDLELVSLESIETLDHYTDRGVEFFVIRPDYFLWSRKSGDGSAALLYELRSSEDIRQVQRFDPGSGPGRGPVIEIYASKPKLHRDE